MSGETESSVSPTLNLENCSVVLLDVAGTTTSINFVKETLFPYVTRKVEEFLKSHWEDDVVKESVKLLKDSEIVLTDAVTAVKELTDQNSENKGLKTIQGLIYKEGYENGDLKAHVFPDVQASIEAWSKSRKVAIYSTGSVESQQLLFSHTTDGDISSHINKYFDQTIGSKTESQSYENIAKELNVEKEVILFITDNVEEAKAAKLSGLLAVLVKRDGNEPFPEETSKEISVISSFKDLIFENPAKRKNEDEVVSTEEQPPSKIAKKEISDEAPIIAETSSEAEVSVQEDKKQEEDAHMEVDSSVEKDTTAEAKSGDKSEAPNENEKTEIDSTEKTEISSTVTKNEEPNNITAEETPMETSESVEECKDENKQVETENNKKINTEQSKDLDVIDAEISKQKNEVVKEDSKLEKMETEAQPIQDKNDEVDKRIVEESCSGTSVTKSAEEIVTDSAVDKAVCDTEENAIKNVENEVTDNVETNIDIKIKECVSEEIPKAEKTVNSETNVTEKENKSNREDKIVQKDTIAEEKTTEIKAAGSANITEKEDDKESAEVKSVEEKENTAKEKSVEVHSKDDKASNIEDSKCEKKSSAKDDQLEGKEVIVEEKADEEMASTSSEPSPKEKPSESVVEEKNSEDNNTEMESNNEESIEEKENKSELANGIENGQAEAETAVNGDSQKKSSDDMKVDEVDKVEEIKVKKVEDSVDTTPPVSVEV